MRTIVVLSLGLAVAACGSPTVTQIGQECGADSKPFIQYWSCQKPRLLAEISAPDDIKQTYIATGDLAQEKAKAGEITDAQARGYMARAYSEAVAEDARRRRPVPNGGDTAGAMADTSRALLQMGGPSAVPFGATAGPAAPKPVYCHTVGPRTTCF